MGPRRKRPCRISVIAQLIHRLYGCDHASCLIVHRHAVGFPAALWGMETLAAGRREPANVADGRGGLGYIRQCGDMGGAG